MRLERRGCEGTVLPRGPQRMVAYLPGPHFPALLFVKAGIEEVSDTSERLNYTVRLESIQDAVDPPAL